MLFIIPPPTTIFHQNTKIFIPSITRYLPRQPSIDRGGGLWLDTDQKSVFATVGVEYKGADLHSALSH